MPEEKKRYLRSDEVSVRVGSAKENGCSLLLYTSQHIVQQIMDELYGSLGWKRSHQMIGDALYCTVSVWDPVKQEWISRQDVGVPGFAEKEKSAASDSLKRACVGFGVARELYTSPFIWIPASQCNIRRSGEKFSCYDSFSVEKITTVDGQIAELVIRNDTLKKIVFTWIKPGMTQFKDVTILEIETEAKRRGVAIDKILETYDVPALKSLTAEQKKNCLARLKKTPVPGDTL